MPQLNEYSWQTFAFLFLFSIVMLSLMIFFYFQDFLETKKKFSNLYYKLLN